MYEEAVVRKAEGRRKEWGNDGSKVDPRVLWQELNQFRKDPAEIKHLLEGRKNYYNKDNLLFSPFQPNKSIKTAEGRQPVNEVISELLNDRALIPIAFNEELASAALHIANQYKVCQNNDVPFNAATYAKDMRGRLSQSSRFGFDHPITCLVGIGFNDQYEPLLSLLVDDGDAERRNRKAILSNSFKFGGVGAVLLADPSLICAVYLLTKDVTPK